MRYFVKLTQPSLDGYRETIKELEQVIKQKGYFLDEKGYQELLERMGGVKFAERYDKDKEIIYLS